MISSDYIKGNSVLVKQRIKINIWVIAIFAFVAILSTIMFAPRSHAEDINNSPNTLKVSPVRTDISIDRGKDDIVPVTVTNLTKSPVTVRLVENDFIAGDERGTPALILDADKYAPTHSLKRFMKPMADITIPAGQSKTAEVVISVPKDALSGGYFGAIRFAPANPATGAQVNLSTSVASLILLTVPGDIVEKLDLTNFEIIQGSKPGTFFNSANDLQVGVRFANSGNIQIGPIGKVSVQSGDKVIYETDFNSSNPREVVLPDSARRWDIPLKNIGSFGHYKVTATFTYGKSNQTIEVVKWFWVVPMTVIIATIVGLLVIIGIVFGIIMFLRGYKRRIVRGGRGGSYRR